MNYLKILTLGLCLAASSVAYAEESIPKPEPIRQAKVKIQVRQGYLGQQDLMKNYQNLCELSGEFPVYAPVEDQYKVSRQYANFDCKGMVNGKAMRVQVSGAVYLEKATAKDPAKKVLRGMIFIWKNEEYLAAQPSYASTTDLSAKNLELYMNSATYDLPEIKSGTPNINVVITMDDAN